MKLRTQAFALSALTLVAGAASAQQTIQSNLNASMRLGLQLDTEPETELSFNNYGSRIRWSGATEISDGLSANGYIELGFDQDAGVSNTRHAWAGIEGDFGELRGGKQYNAFYDAVSSFVDIAYWESCILELSCARESSTIKYTGSEEDDFQYTASTRVLNNNDDFIDGLEFGAKFSRGDLNLGIGASVAFTGGDAGFGVGIAAAMPLSGGALVTGTVQLAEEDNLAFAINDAGDIVPITGTRFIVTGTYAKDQYYALATLLDADETGLSLVGGYIYPVVADKALIYFEAGISDQASPNSDTNVFGRGVFIFNFDVLSTSST